MIVIEPSHVWERFIHTRMSTIPRESVEHDADRDGWDEIDPQGIAGNGQHEPVTIDVARTLEANRISLAGLRKWLFWLYKR